MNPLGRIIRGIHDFGASAMIILIGIHTIRVYLTGSYKHPRQMNWHYRSWLIGAHDMTSQLQR